MRFLAPCLNRIVNILNRPHLLRENRLLLPIRDSQVVDQTEPVTSDNRLHFVVTIGVKGHKARRKEAAVGKRVALALTSVANDQFAAFMLGGQIHNQGSKHVGDLFCIPMGCEKRAFFINQQLVLFKADFAAG